MSNKRSKTEPQAPKSYNGFVGWFASMKKLLPGYYGPLLWFSLAINLLMMVSPLYMLQVYDRVLTSGSTDTLIWISGIALFLLVIYAAAEAGRRRICNLAAEALEEKVSERIFSDFETGQAHQSKLTENLMVLGRLRSLFQNQTVLPFFDLPFAPFFLLIMFLIHPVIGFIGLGGGALVFFVAVLAEFTSRRTNEMSSAASSQAFHVASGLSRQRSAMISMGLSQNVLHKWREAKDVARELNMKAGAREGGFSSIAKAARQILQILVLGGGAALALNQQVSPGAIVAGSIIMSRALAPIDQIVGSWRSVTMARTAWNQLQHLEVEEKAETNFTPLPRPAPVLAISRLSVATPGAGIEVIRPFSLKVEGGCFYSLVGGIGAGKTTLLQTLAAAWQPQSGSISLGGRDIHSWPSQDRGQYFGYVPQDVELMPGTIAENIARMSDASPEAVIDAAMKAGAHEMILSQAEGYETMIGPQNETGLSAGQRQLIGLARALFGNPVVLLLDEPTANLDPASSVAAISNLKRAADEGTIVIAASHDETLIEASGDVLIIRDGTVMAANTKQYLNHVRTKPSEGITKIGARAS